MVNESMDIKTERLFIRKIVADDWASIKRIWDDFGKSEYAKYDIPHKSKEDEVIGYIDFHNTGNGYDSGYCFHSAYHGKGYAKESYQALINFWRGMGVRKLIAGTAMKNIPSVRLLSSLGFKQTGTERLSFYKDNSGNDIYFDGGIFELNIR